MIWKPNTTVAAIIEQDGRFLMVEENTNEGVRINQPAGHLEDGESLFDGVVREAFEETYDYRTSQPEQATPAVGATPRAAPAEAVPASRSRPSGGLTPQEQQELEQLRARFKK